MPNIKYADEIGGVLNRIDFQNSQLNSGTKTSVKDITSASLDYSLQVNSDKWKVNEIALEFSATDARAITISKKSSVTIVDKMNDRLWISADGAITQRVDLTAGTYTTGTALATMIQGVLNATAAFVAAGLTFTVSWGAVTKKLSIVEDGGATINFYSINTRTAVRRNSTAGPVIGLEADQSGATITSNAFDIDASYVLVSEAANASLSYVVTDNFEMTRDTILNVDTNTVSGLVVSAKITYEKVSP